MEVGNQVVCNGFPGTITEIYTGKLNGMIEVRLERGTVCVDATQVVLVDHCLNVKSLAGISTDERYALNYGVDEDSGEYFVEDRNGRVAEGLDFKHARLFANAPFLLSTVRSFMNSFPSPLQERIGELLEREGLL